MSRPTHIRELDGFVRGPLNDTFRPCPDQIRRSLNNLDGHSSWGYRLWRAPIDADSLEDMPESEEHIRWDEGRHSTSVYPAEVFTADEATDVLYGYFLNDKVTDTFALRELDLNIRLHPLSVP